MATTLYFSKVNNNSHILEIYDDKELMNKILTKMYNDINETTTYYRNDIREVDGEFYEYNAEYKFINLTKILPDEFPALSLVGSIMKKAPVFVNELDEATGELRKLVVDNTEVIDFYFDINKEIIVYHATLRFGYQEFNNAIGELLSLCMSTEDDEYYFNVSLLKEGLSVAEIKEELKKIGKIETLKIEIIPPNAGDRILDSIQNNGEERINNFKAARITNHSVIFESKDKYGINIDSDIVNKELDAIKEIHSTLSEEESTAYSYVTVEATSKKGRMYTTDESKPIKAKLDVKTTGQIGFAAACKQKISSIFS